MIQGFLDFYKEIWHSKMAGAFLGCVVLATIIAAIILLPAYIALRKYE